MAIVSDSTGLGANYRRLLISAASSNLGDGVRAAALPLLAVTLTDEPLLISGVAAATFLPAVLFGPIGGVLVDRAPRRRLIVLGQFLRAAAAGLFVLSLLGEVGGISAVYVLALALGRERWSSTVLHRPPCRHSPRVGCWNARTPG